MTALEWSDQSWFLGVAERGRTSWPALDEAERENVVAHCRASDYPETAAWWLSLGEACGFASARELIEAPPGLGRVYRFAA